MSEIDESKSDSAEVKSPWTPKVRRLLEDWRQRADDASKTHYAQASRLSALNLILGAHNVCGHERFRHASGSREHGDADRRWCR
jgi:hypothetical protein